MLKVCNTYIIVNLRRLDFQKRAISNERPELHAYSTR